MHRSMMSNLVQVMYQILKKKRQKRTNSITKTYQSSTQSNRVMLASWPKPDSVGEDEKNNDLHIDPNCLNKGHQRGSVTPETLVMLTKYPFLNHQV
mmetsp:Transcript_4272/g.5549  ORF Transcript_4272/g.5549 Transcript_4272/m.5549 type:complete len:96 (+) Transcript_4272:62-349(+)